MSEFADLTRLLAPRPSPTSGVVTRLGDGTARVATPDGAIEVAVVGRVGVGQRVNLSDGVARAAPKAGLIIPV